MSGKGTSWGKRQGHYCIMNRQKDNWRMRPPANSGSRAQKRHERCAIFMKKGVWRQRVEQKCTRRGESAFREKVRCGARMGDGNTPVSAEFHFWAGDNWLAPYQCIRSSALCKDETYFFMSIHRSAFPIVCDSSWIWYVAADKSGSAPLSYAAIVCVTSFCATRTCKTMVDVQFGFLEGLPP